MLGKLQPKENIEVCNISGQKTSQTQQIAQ